MSDDPIAELLLAVAMQDRAAFRQLYFESGAKLLGVLIRMLGTRAEAEDALQEVFIRVWLHAERYDASKGRAKTWLTALARHHAIDKLRARPNHVSGDYAIEAAAHSAPHAELRMVAMGEARRIGDCLGNLEPEKAAMVREAYLHGHSYRELTERFEMPLNTVRTSLRHSLLKLRNCMET